MGALRMPVIEIPISDSQAQKFFDSFRKYQANLEKTPAFWKQTNTAILSQGEAFRRLGNASKPAESAWRSLARWSGSVLSHTMSITRELLKWSSLIGGGLLGGSLFGITRMASDVSGYRQRAMSLGMGIGSMRSFDVNFARLGDPGGFLSAINQAISNPALQGPLYSLGVNPNGSTSQVSVAMLKAMRRLAQNTPRGELGLMSDAYNLGPFGGLTKLMLLKSMGSKEFASLLAGNAADRGPLGMPSRTALAWQQFSTQLDLAGGEIFSVFVKGLAPLEKPLQHLSGAFTGLLTRLMQGPLLKEGINNLAHILETFSTKMASKKFEAAVSSLVSDTGTVAQAFHALASTVRGFEKNPVKAAGKLAFDTVIKAPFDTGWAVGREIAGPGASAISKAWHGLTTTQYPTTVLGHPLRGTFKPEMVAEANKLDAMFGFPAGTMRRLIQTESSFNPGAKSSKGAMGLTQLMPGTARQFGLYGNAPYDWKLSEVAGAEYLAHLVKQYHGNLQQALAAYNLGPGKFDSRYGGNLGAVPRSVRHYVTAVTEPGIVVTARHKTGANSVLTSAALAGGVPQ
jgi:hypothetical protein